MLNTSNDSTSNLVSLNWYDIACFFAILAISTLIGIYYGWFDSKPSSAEEYLKGGKRMKIIPVALSVAISHISTVSFLGYPAEVYIYGSEVFWCVFSQIIAFFITAYIYMPIFFNLQVTSVFEYLEKRFDNKTRLFASFLSVFHGNIFLVILAYGPALAVSAATGINARLINLIVSTVCIFYTVIGGLKTVIWTDVFQFLVTISTLIIVLTIGIYSSGGISSIWEVSQKGDRLSIFE